MHLSCKALAFCAISGVGIALAAGITPAPGGTIPVQPLIVSTDFFQGPGQYGGTLYEVLGGAPDSFNIYGTVSPRTYTVMMHNVLSSLIRENPVTGALRPGLLTSWDVSDNGLTYTLHLREGVRWSDGTPLTASDVIFTMRCAQENPVARGNNVASFTLNGKLVDFTSPNSETVVARLAKPNGGFPQLLSEVYIIPKHKLAQDCPLYNPKATNQQFNDAWSINTPPKDIVGTGPFTLKSYIPGQKVVLARNPYSFYVSPYGQQLPYANQLVYLIASNPQVQIAMFESGQLSTLGLDASQFTTLKQKQVAGASFDVLRAKSPYPPVPSIYFNYRTKDSDLAKLFYNTRFRQAVGYAIDYPRIISDVYNTLASAPVGWITPASKDYSAEYASAYGQYNPSKAKVLLGQLGLRMGPNGYLVFPDGKTLDFTMITYGENSPLQKMAEIIQADLKSVGIKMDVKYEKFSLLLQQSFGGNFEASFFAFATTPNNQFRQPIWQPGGSLYFWNKAAYHASKPVLSAMRPWELVLFNLFDNLDSTTGQQARNVIWKQIQEIYAQQQPVVFTVFPGAAMAAVQANVHNFFVHGGYLWGKTYAMYVK